MANSAFVKIVKRLSMTKNSMKKVYLISPKIKWKSFKAIHDKIVHDSGPKPENIEKVLWEMIRDKKIIAWFAEDFPNDMGLGLKFPDRYKKWELNIIS